jgi:hypothetical protein
VKSGQPCVGLTFRESWETRSAMRSGVGSVWSQNLWCALMLPGMAPPAQPGPQGRSVGHFHSISCILNGKWAGTLK